MRIGQDSMSGEINSSSHELNSLYAKVSELVSAARNQVRATVNQAMVMTYWQIGQLIVEDEQSGDVRAEYGKTVLKNLSEQLTDQFGKGFDISNLRYMRRFYLTFSNRDALRPDLSWTHYRLLLKVRQHVSGTCEKRVWRVGLLGHWTDRSIRFTMSDCCRVKMKIRCG